jgi:hypothetical protein
VPLPRALQLPTHGLLNIIAAPQLGEQSTYAAVYSSPGGHLVAPNSAALVEAFEQYVHSSEYPALVGGVLAWQLWSCRAAHESQCTHYRLLPLCMTWASASERALADEPRSHLQVGGHWASGRPFLSAAAKQTDTPWDAGLALPLVVLDVSELKVGRALLPGLPRPPPAASPGPSVAVLAGAHGELAEPAQLRPARRSWWRLRPRRCGTPRSSGAATRSSTGASRTWSASSPACRP